MPSMTFVPRFGESLPSRGRGLKRGGSECSYGVVGIAPFAGARIETMSSASLYSRLGKSLPSRERGLKRPQLPAHPPISWIAPFAGARIETMSTSMP